ncbi:MAG: 6-phosphogluconolactonase [Actinomycetota bacterium]
MKTITEETVSELLKSFASDFEKLAHETLSHKDTFEVVLTGGTLGIRVLGEIAKLDLPWRRISFQFGDERFVALTHPDRNEFQAISLWPELANMNLHRFPDANSSLEVARSEFDHAVSLRLGELDNPNPVFDLVILGMGPDGHVASLFPGRNYPKTWIVSEGASPKPPSERLSFSYEALNKASEVWFLASGAEKAEAVRCGISSNCDLPLAKIRGREMTRWYLDSALNDAL